MAKRDNIRFKKRWEFQRVYQKNRKASMNHITIFVYDGHALREDTFFGVTVTKKIGNAVVRNKIKRRVIEIFFHLRPFVKKYYDLVFMPKRNCAEITFSELNNEIKEGLALLDLLSEENTVQNGGSGS